MSTDYSIKCVECNRFSPLSDATRYAVEYGMARASAFIALWKFYQQHMPALQEVDLSAYWCSDFHSFLAWLTEHEAHTLMVEDDYGREYPEIKRG